MQLYVLISMTLSISTTRSVWVTRMLVVLSSSWLSVVDDTDPSEGQLSSDSVNQAGPCHLDCSQSPIFPCDRRCSCGSHNASETGESAKCPWVGVVEGTAGGKNRETVTASLCLVFNGRSRHLASPLIKSINSLFREEKACQIS